MKKYIKPTSEAMGLGLKGENIAEDMVVVDSYSAKQGAGDKYSDGLVKEENSSFWE